MSADEWERIRLEVRLQALRLLELPKEFEPEPIQVKKGNRWDVFRFRKPATRAIVRLRKDGQWRCSCDSRDMEDNPCYHIVAVRVSINDLQRPNTSGDVAYKTENRNHTLETRAWEMVPVELPKLLARLLKQGLPAFAPDPEDNPKGGQERCPTYAKAYQAIMRVAVRQSLRCNRGEMRLPHHQALNPDGPVGIATISRWLADPATTQVLEKLLALTTAPARPYERLVHPDGTGLSQSHFSPYLEERPSKRAPPKDEQSNPEDDDGKNPKRRRRLWTYTEILWTYRYTLVAAVHSQERSFGEAPWLIPLLIRARLLLDVKELGGDKAYDANYIFQYARLHDIDAQVKIRKTAPSARSKKDRKEKFREKALDPGGYAAKANRRNNAETGNHALKAILGDQIYSTGTPYDDGSRDFRTRQNEVLTMCIAYNLTRLIYMSVDQDVAIDFAAGVEALQKADWRPLDALHQTYFKSAEPLPVQDP